MSYYHAGLETQNNSSLASGLFFPVEQTEQLAPQLPIHSEEAASQTLKYNEFVIPDYHQTKEGTELYLPLLEVSVEVEVVGTIAWTKLIQTFTNPATFPIKEAIYCFPLYDKSSVTSFTCSVGLKRVLKGVVKPKLQAKAEFKAAVARRCVAALLEEHTPEVFETSIGNIPSRSTVKVEICYLTELKADPSGDGILVTIPTSVAPRYGTPPGSFTSATSSRNLAVPSENGLRIQIEVSLPVAINIIESRTHPAKIEMGSHGLMTTKNIRDLAKKKESSDYDPKKARATLSDRNACLGKDFVLLIQSHGGKLLASCAKREAHPTLPDHSALMVSINLRDLYTPDVIAPKSQNEIIFLADQSGSMQDKIETLKTAMGFFLKSLPNNCLFNICSFGSYHVLMWPESRPYCQKNLDEAMSYITTNFSENMGNTELLSGLWNVFQKRNLITNTQIIILTDGEVWDTDNTLKFIREATSSKKKRETRFFALGIGDAVSHRLVEGIGRYGGGLSEVVSVSSTSDWKERVIRMLEAALTPSTWNVEICFDNAPTTPNPEERNFIQAPQYIPNFHAFSRSSIYFLFYREINSQSVKVKLTATTGEVVNAKLPIQTLEYERTYIHQLAAKAVILDLECGESWFHANQSKNMKSKAEVEDFSKIEGEKISLEWSIPSKWTSFVIVDSSSSLEKHSRWYQAERTELADLTRTRLSATNPPTSGRYQTVSSGSCDIYALRPLRAQMYSSDTSFYCASTRNEDVEETLSAHDSPPVRHFARSAKLTQNKSRVERSALTNLGPLPSTSAPKQVDQYFSELERRGMSGVITLEGLINAQTAEGNFKLDLRLGTALKTKFRHWRFDLLVNELGESLFGGSVSEVLETARCVVFIKAMYAESRQLWELAVQKAEAFIAKGVIDKIDVEKPLFGVLESQVFGDEEAINRNLRREHLSRYERKILNRLIKSGLLDNSEELLPLLRSRDIVERDGKKTIRILGRKGLFTSHKNQYLEAVPAHEGDRGQDPDLWIDGWDDILRISQAIDLVVKEKTGQ